MGALGPVFRTYEPTRDRLVAVKVFRLDITPEGAQTLADELAVATGAGLFHPSIVEPIASGVEGTVAYRAEEYVAAESLDVAMRHYAPASMDKVLPFISQLAAAVDFARMAGVGHGALHPRDIFVTTEEARATGFGVVEALERMGLRAPVRRPYSAPERVAGEQWSTPADVFSLSAIAYELLTGRRPAGVGADIGDLSGASLGAHSSAVRSVLVRGMEEDPAARFPTAMAFASALESASRGESAMPAVAAPPAAPVLKPVAPAPVAPPVQRPVSAATPIRPVVVDDEDDEDEDIVAEREEDAEYAAFAPERSDAEARPLDLFEGEAVEDLALDMPPVRFADEFGAAAAEEPPPRFDRPIEPVEPIEMHVDADDDGGGYVPPRRSIDYVPPDETFAVLEPPRRRTLPLALMLLLGLAVGFAAGWGAGYGAASRGSANDATPAAGAEKPATAAPPQTAEGGKAYSEQAVSPSKPVPSTSPPPVPGDAPPASPPPATPAPPAQGRIIVRSVPAGAAVTIDGKWRGRTPMTLDKMALGDHEVRVVQTGFEVATESVSLSARAPSRTLSLKLRRTARAAPPPVTPPAPAPRATKPAPAAVPPTRAKGPGSLYVDSRPRGATVFLDGKQIGVTPVSLQDVPAGAHVVRLELADHRVWTANSQVLAGQQTRVTGSLERIR